MSITLSGENRQPSRADSCTTCRVGPKTIYAPTLERSPEKLCSIRRDVQQYRQHQVIKRANEPIEFVGTLRHGWACRAMHFPDGRRQILAFLAPGDTISVEAICLPDYQPPYTIRALTEVAICTFDPSTLHDLVFSCPLQREHFARYVLEQQALAERRLADVGRRRAVGSLAHLLIEIFTTLRRRGLTAGNCAEFPLRQEDLADALGLTPAHINRKLLSLRERGLIVIQNGKLEMLDLDGLREVAIDN